jgi:ketosteroid isomerase-like protein
MSSGASSVILEWTEAFNRHDPDAYARYFGDDCVRARSSAAREPRARSDRTMAPRCSH